MKSESENKTLATWHGIKDYVQKLGLNPTDINDQWCIVSFGDTKVSFKPGLIEPGKWEPKRDGPGQIIVQLPGKYRIESHLHLEPAFEYLIEYFQAELNTISGYLGGLASKEQK